MRSLDDDLGVRERRVDVAAGDRPVKRALFGTSSCSCGAPGLHGFLGIDDGRQRLVVDVDELERIVRLMRRLGDDDGDDVADVADGVLRERVIAARS